MQPSKVISTLKQKCEEANKFQSAPKSSSKWPATGSPIAAPGWEHLMPFVAIGYDSMRPSIIYIGIRIDRSANITDGRLLSKKLLQCLPDWDRKGSSTGSWFFSATEKRSPNYWPLWQDYDIRELQEEDLDSFIEQLCKDFKALAAAFASCVK